MGHGWGAAGVIIPASRPLEGGKDAPTLQRNVSMGVTPAHVGFGSECVGAGGGGGGTDDISTSRAASRGQSFAWLPPSVELTFLTSLWEALR